MSRQGAPPADGALANTHLEGSRQAFEDLFARYSNRLTGYCRRIGAQEDAEDLAQEALIRAWANLGRFDTTRPMWPWLKAIASNLAIDRARARGREILLQPDHDEASFDGVEERVEERALLSEAMETLTPSQRTVLRLRYLEDWDTAQVATFLGLSAPALKQLAYRARERLLTEYRRLAEGSLAWILVPLRVIRRWLRPPVSRVQRTAARVGANVGVVGDGGYQLAVGVISLSLLLGGLTAPRAGDPAGESEIAPVATGRAAGSSLDTSRALPNQSSIRNEGDHASSPPAVVLIEQAKESKGARKKVDEAAQAIVGGVIDPNAQTDAPEQALIQSVAFSPRFAADQTVFAAGIASCRRRLCPSVLFRSSDGGTTWIRHAAVGLVADTLFLPPAYGPDDERIFAMGTNGLQVSDDGGQTFHAAPVVSGPQTAGSAAMSPYFSENDPTILIGAETLMRYRDDRKTLEPFPATAPRGPFEPAFSPAYASDRTVLLGGSRLDPAAGTVATVYRCVDALCSPISLGGEELRPKVRVAADFSWSGKAYAFTPETLFASEDGGESFTTVPLDPADEWLWDLVVHPEGKLFAATVPKEPGGTAGLYMSTDSGRTWSELESPLLARGAASIGLSGDRIVVGLYEGGVACSSDAGLTWSARCEPAAAP